MIFHLRQSSFLSSHFFITAICTLWQNLEMRKKKGTLSFICIYHSVNLSSPLYQKGVKQRRDAERMWQWIRNWTCHHLILTATLSEVRFIRRYHFGRKHRLKLQDSLDLHFNLSNQRPFSVHHQKNSNQSELKGMQGKPKSWILLGTFLNRNLTQEIFNRLQEPRECFMKKMLMRVHFLPKWGSACKSF